MEFDNGTVADFDQLQQEAIVRLRTARTFFVATLDKKGNFQLTYCADGGLADPFIDELVDQVTELVENR